MVKSSKASKKDFVVRFFHAAASKVKTSLSVSTFKPAWTRDLTAASPQTGGEIKLSHFNTFFVSCYQSDMLTFELLSFAVSISLSRGLSGHVTPPTATWAS